MMVASVQELSPFQQKTRERRIIKAVVADLVASSRFMETPIGLVTLVDIRFLAELADVASVTGEHLYAVVDETHLARVAQSVGLIQELPRPATLEGSPLVVRPEDVKAAFRWKGWTVRYAAIQLGVSQSSVNNWIYGYGQPRGESRQKLHDLIAEMHAAMAANDGGG